MRACVGAAEPEGVPVTMKFRMGVDDDVLTYLEAGRIAEDEGVAAVALHARTAEQLYSGSADWAAIGELKAAVTRVPVLGNGDIWEAADALAMVAETGCDGVVVGRGCLGRPWLFGDLEAAFAGQEPAPAPRLGEVIAVMAEHARLLGRLARRGRRRLRDFRKHTGWYLTGYPVGSGHPAAAGRGEHPGRARRPPGHARSRPRLVPGRAAAPSGPHQRAPSGAPAAGLARRSRRRHAPAARGRRPGLGRVSGRTGPGVGLAAARPC